MWYLIPLALLLQQFSPCSIEGRVANLFSGNPVRKAQILVRTEAGVEKYHAIAGSDGRYSVSGMAPGKYRLSVQRTGFLPVVYGAHGPNRTGKILVLAAGETRKNVDFTLEPPAVVTGHIYDEDGEPLSTAVFLYRQVWRDGRIHLEQAAGANADDEGEYRLYGLPPGTYLVGSAQRPVRPFNPIPSREVYPQTFYPGTENASGAAALKLAAGAEARIDLHLQKTTAVTVKGAVIVPAAAPVQLTLAPRDGAPQSRVVSSINQTGEFRLGPVTPGAYILSARPVVGDIAFFARTNLDVGTLDVEGLQITLTPTLDLAGVLKVESREPLNLPTFSLVLTAAELGIPPAVARPNEKGAFAWKGLEPGRWTVDFNPRLPGVYLKSPTEIDIPPEGHAPVEVLLSANGASVAGKVQTAADNPAALEGATVLLISQTIPARVRKYAATDSEGKYSLSGIPPGKYRLLALEDIENLSWENPEVTASFEGKGIELELSENQKSIQDLIAAR